MEENHTGDTSCLNYIYWFATLYILVKILSNLRSFVNNYIITIFKEPQNFKYYGQWAVITGSTDGIGKGFAKELASRGVDICLISRNEEKLKNVAKEIEDNYEVKIKYIVADFTNPNLYGHIKENLSDLDIGILVNNVGMVSERMESFSRHSEELIKNYINVNMLSTAMMTSIVLAYMIPKKRGLIINISSMAGEIVSPSAAIYSGTKSFMSMFGSCLDYEIKKHNIRVKTLTPGYVSTKMIRQDSQIHKLARTIPYIFPTVDEYVKSAMMSFNSNNIKSCGYFGHEILLMASKSFPATVLTEFLKKVFSSSSKKKT